MVWDPRAQGRLFTGKVESESTFKNFVNLILIDKGGDGFQLRDIDGNVTPVPTGITVNIQGLSVRVSSYMCVIAPESGTLDVSWICDVRPAPYYVGDNGMGDGTVKNLYGGLYNFYAVDKHAGTANVNKRVFGGLYNWYAATHQHAGDVTIKYGYLYNWYAATARTSGDNKTEYGGLYNNYVVTKNGGSGAGSIAPAGWHVPTINEWDTLILELGGYSVAGTHLKEAGTTHWTHALGDNSSGFSARGSGFRNNDGVFSSLKQYAQFYGIASVYGNYVILRDVDGVIPTPNSRCDDAVALALRLVKDDSTDPGTMTDYDGNVYPTVKIGGQVWMASNLKVEHFNDGVPITILGSEWSYPGYSAMCYFNNTNIPLLPSAGWHVPSASDFETLALFLDPAGTMFSNIAGGKLKEAGTDHWLTPNTGADNSSGFNLRGGGSRNAIGPFGNLKGTASLWCTEDISSVYAATNYLTNVSGSFFYSTDVIPYYYPTPKKGGLSVRLVKDVTSLTNGQTGSYRGNDGRTYATICIGTQEWLSENLAETTYRNTNLIAKVTDNSAWAALTDGGYCANNNDEMNAFEGIYDLAPTGWHVPTTAEFVTLVGALDPSGTITSNTAGGALKEAGLAHWLTPNSGATNSSGMTIYGSGFRASNGNYIGQMTDSWYHSSTNYLLNILDPQGLCLSAYNAIATYWSPGGDVNIVRSGMPIRLIKDDSTDPGTMTDIDNNVYPTVKIGGQVWMAENLKVEHYNDGSAIPIVTDKPSWAASTTGAMCYFDNTADTITQYLLPMPGWHVPTATEWATLLAELVEDQGKKLKESGVVYWKSPNSGTNEAGFSARGTGKRAPTGEYSLISELAYFYSASLSADRPMVYLLQYNSDSVILVLQASKLGGNPVRLIKDDDTDPGSVTDIDGNVYATTKIGNQVWMASNLKVEHYNNGDPIPVITDSSQWASDTQGAITGGVSYFNNGV